MQIYQCPNCGRKYTEFQNVYYCGTCNHKLLKQQDITKINNPELSKRDYKIIGRIKDPTKSTVTCPYCQSTHVSRIGFLNRMVSVELWGFASSKIGKQWHCDSCDSDF